MVNKDEYIYLAETIRKVNLVEKLMLKNCCFITLCKAHSKVTHIKQQIYFHHLKGRGYNKNSVLYPVKSKSLM